MTDPNPTTSNVNNETSSQIGDTAPSTFLMYNKISNIYGTAVDGATGSGGSINTDKSGNKDKKKTNEEKNKDSAIWYEYGCV